jgi:putative Holliday junction resolvase
MKFIGIDYGTKRVGVALSDEEGKIAFPKEVLPCSNRLIEELLDICIREEVGGMVVGESKNLDGSANPLMKDIDRFVSKWRRESRIPLFLEPEYMTSHQAHRVQGKHALLDASAAALILQSYLDKRAHIASQNIKVGP